jgi:hypothetical protein
MKKQNPYISISILIIFLVQNIFAQKVTVEGSDERTEGIKDGHTYYDYDPSDNTHEGNSKDAGNNNQASPEPEQGGDNDSGGSNRENGYGENGASTNAGNGNSNGTEGNGSSGGSIAEKEFDKVIRDSHWGPGRGSHEHSGEAGEYRTDSKNDGSTHSNSRNFNSLVEKGYFARDIIQQKLNDINLSLQKHRTFLAGAISVSKLQQVNKAYENSGSFAAQDVLQIQNLVGALALSNQEALFSSVIGQLNGSGYKDLSYKQELLRKELRKIFPEVYEKNIQQISQARKILKNWKMVDDVIENGSLFKDKFIQAGDAIQVVEGAVNFNGLGPVDSELMDSINHIDAQMYVRFADYINDYIASINAGQIDAGIESRKEAVEYLHAAFNRVFLEQDYFQAANDLMSVKELFQYSGALEDAPNPLEFISIGVVASIGKKVVRYGLEDILKYAVTVEERAIVRIAINKMVRSEVTVLGSRGYYVELGEKMRANILNIPDEIWRRMPDVEKKKINFKFLDLAIARGDKFILSNSAFEVRTGTAFWEELEYMIAKGYKVSEDGMSLFK